MAWAWMFWLSDALGTRILLSFGHGSSGYLLPYALGTRTLLWFEHGCSGYRTHSEHERYYGLGMDALATCYRMLWEHERYYGLRMDALVIGCTRNTSVIMVWAWMLWLSDALRTRTLLWFWAWMLCGYRMHSEHERYYGLGRGSGCFGPTVRYYPHPHPPNPPEAKLRNPAKQGTEISPLA